MIMFGLVFQMANVKSQTLLALTNEIQTIYQYLNNPISVNSDCFSSNVELFTDNGEIQNVENQIYWKPKEIGISFLKLIDKENQKVIDSLKFMVKSYGLPILKLSNKVWHSGIEDYDLEKLKFDLDKRYEYLKLNENIQVKSFEMEVVLEKKGGEMKTYKLKGIGEMIPTEFDNVKNQLQVGDILTVELQKIEINCNWMPNVKYYDEYNFLPEYLTRWIWEIQ